MLLLLTDSSSSMQDGSGKRDATGFVSTAFQLGEKLWQCVHCAARDELREFS